MTRLFSSLRARFLAAILIWVALGIGALWFSSVRLFSSHVEQQYHEELEVHVRELAELTVLDAAGNPRLSRPLSDPRYAVPLSGFYWQIGRPGYRSLKSPSMTRGALDEDVAHSPDILHRVENGPTGPTITYGFERAVPGGAPLHFVIATDERLLRAVIASFTRELSLWLSLLALALLASGLAIITLGFRPFNRLAARIAALRRGQADHIEGVFPDEIRQLVDPLNSYLARNAEIVERGRVAAGALAHSLRTPLAVVTDEAERLQQRGTESAAADVFLSESETMQRQIDYHLSRVRSGGSHAGMVGGVRLAAILSPLIAAMERCHPGKRFAATAAALDPAAPSLPMDAEDLSEILSNLLDNAGKWARSGITIDYRFDGAARRIAITDDGPGVPPDQREAMFGIGARGAGPGAGSGLGLAIARDVARDYGGDVALDRAPSGGTLATLRIGDGPAGDM